MVEKGSMSYLASGNRKYVNIEQAKEELKAAAEANKGNVRTQRDAAPYGRRKIASQLGTNCTPIKPINIQPVTV